MPGARARTRSLACKNKKHTSKSPQVEPANRHSLRDGFSGFLRALPGDRAFLSPSPAQCASIAADLISASRYQDATTSPSACQCIRLTHQKRPPLPAPNVRDDRETPLFIEHGMAGIVPVIWGGDQPRGLRPINATGKSGAAAEMLSSDEQLLASSSFRGAPLGASPESIAPHQCSEEWIPGLRLTAHPGMTTRRIAQRPGKADARGHRQDDGGPRIALDTPTPRFVNRTLLASSRRPGA